MSCAKSPETDPPDFTGQNLTGHDFSNQDLREAVFTGAILVGANFSRACLDGATLDRADLTQANFRYAHMEGASLKRTYLDRTIFRCAFLSYSDFGNAALIDVDFTRADLSGAVISDTRLKACHITNAVLPDWSIVYETQLTLEGGYLMNFENNALATFD